MDTVTATATATTSATATDTTDTTARGPLMLSPRLRLLPLLSPATDTTAMDTATDTDMATTDTTATDTTATTARGPLMPSPDTATATTDKKFHSEVVQFRVQYKNKHKKLDHSVLVLNCCPAGGGPTGPNVVRQSVSHACSK